MQVQKIQQNIFMSQNQTAQNKRDRAEYARRRLDETSNDYMLEGFANACLITGAGLLAYKNFDKSFKEMSKTEKAGTGILVAGIVLAFADMIRRAVMSSKYKKEYDDLRG